MTKFSISETTLYQIWCTYKIIWLLRTHLPSYQCTPHTFSIFSFFSHSHFSRTLLWYVSPFQLFNPALPLTFSIFSASHVPISLAHFSDTFPYFNSLAQLCLIPSPSFQLLTFPFISHTSLIRLPHFSSSTQLGGIFDQDAHNINSHILQLTDLILLSYLNFKKTSIQNDYIFYISNNIVSTMIHL
jgi:hypothetical protein